MPVPELNTTTVRNYLLALQRRICETVGEEDGELFLEDRWARPAGGSLEGEGLTCLLEGGALLERGGCGFSHVKGPSLPPSATQASQAPTDSGSPQ